MTTRISLDGAIGILKPPGMTSHDVVAMVRRRWQAPKVGHAGTLDPLAAGVLPVLFGAATRLADLVGTVGKRYRADVLLGLSTTTADLAGQVLSADRRAAQDAVSRAGPGGLAAAVAELTGRTLQAPPAYSARRIGGRRLYDMARQGQVSTEDLAAASREIEVYDSKLVRLRLLGWGEYKGWPVATIDLACSSGTYVRELAVRLGDLLGVPACLAFLLRTHAGGLTLADCVTVEQVLAPAATVRPCQYRGHWRDPAVAVSFLPGAVLDAEGSRLVRHGLPIPAERVSAWLAPSDVSRNHEWIRLLNADGELLALAVRGPAGCQSGRDPDPSPAVLRPKRVFPASQAVGGGRGAVQVDGLVDDAQADGSGD